MDEQRQYHFFGMPVTLFTEKRDTHAITIKIDATEKGKPFAKQKADELNELVYLVLNPNKSELSSGVAQDGGFASSYFFDDSHRDQYTSQKMFQELAKTFDKLIQKMETVNGSTDAALSSLMAELRGREIAVKGPGCYDDGSSFANRMQPNFRKDMMAAMLAVIKKSSPMKEEIEAYAEAVFNEANEKIDTSVVNRQLAELVTNAILAPFTHVGYRQILDDDVLAGDVDERAAARAQKDSEMQARIIKAIKPILKNTGAHRYYAGLFADAAHAVIAQAKAEKEEAARQRS